MMQIKHKLRSKSEHARAAPTSAFREAVFGLWTLFFSPLFFMSKFWRMQWHAEAKWSGYNGAEMLNGGWGRFRVMGWRRSNKHIPCILLFAPTMISTDGFIYLQVVCVSLSSHCLLFGLTLMRLSRGRLLCVWSNHWSVQTEFIVSPVIATGSDYVLYWPTLRLTFFFFTFITYLAVIYPGRVHVWGRHGPFSSPPVLSLH